MTTPARVFIDASLFLGMHSRDESVRVSSKNFIVGRLQEGVTMSLEHVGRCDDIIWRYGRTLQDAYYPFMDNLHTDMRIERVGYEEEELRLALDSPLLAELSLFHRTLLARVLRTGGVLFTVSPRLLGRRALPVQSPVSGPEAEFPERLERLYRTSLELRLETQEL